MTERVKKYPAKAIDRRRRIAREQQDLYEREQRIDQLTGRLNDEDDLEELDYDE